MALLSGTAAQLALDLLRSGRAFRDDGVKTLQKAYKATNRGEAMSESAVSEFKKLVKALEAEAIQRRIQHSRIPYSAERAEQLKLMRGTPWSDVRMTERYIPKSVNYWIDFLPGQVGYDLRSTKPGISGYDLRAAEEFKKSARKADSTAEMSGGKHRTVRRAEAVEDRTNAAIIEALVNLFGGR